MGCGTSKDAHTPVGGRSPTNKNNLGNGTNPLVASSSGSCGTSSLNLSPKLVQASLSGPIIRTMTSFLPPGEAELSDISSRGESSMCSSRGGAEGMFGGGPISSIMPADATSRRTHRIGGAGAVTDLLREEAFNPIDDLFVYDDVQVSKSPTTIAKGGAAAGKGKLGISGIGRHPMLLRPSSADHHGSFSSANGLTSSSSSARGGRWILYNDVPLLVDELAFDADGGSALGKSLNSKPAVESSMNAMANPLLNHPTAGAAAAGGPAAGGSSNNTSGAFGASLTNNNNSHNRSTAGSSGPPVADGGGTAILSVLGVVGSHNDLVGAAGGNTSNTHNNGNSTITVGGGAAIPSFVSDAATISHSAAIAAAIREANVAARSAVPSVTLANGTICRATNVCNTLSKQQFLQQQAVAVRAKGHANVHSLKVEHHIGHACRVKCIAIAPGDNEFVSCSNEDSVVTLVSAKSGQEVSSFAGHQDTVISATFSADGKYLATTSRDHTMILWDVVTAKQILQFDHAKVVICCTFSRDSRFVATGCQDKVCRLWETRKGRETVFFPDHEGIIICMSYSPDNCYIASASADKTVRVWSTSTGKAKFVLRGHSGIVLSCSYTNDGLRIISNDEKMVKIWESTTGTCLKTIAVEDFVTNHTSMLSRKLTWTLSCVAPGLFTKFIIVACNNRFVYVIDVATGQEVASYFCKAPVYCLASGFQNMAAFGDSFGNLYLAQLQ